MKIIHLTDTHLLGADRANVYGINPAYLFKKAIKSINNNHADAEFIAITGDLAHAATEGAYSILKSVIEKSKIPIHIIPGNHDDRKYLNKYFPNLVDNGFIQYSYKIDEKVFLFLDTLVAGERYGEMCDERLKWLQNKLDKYKDYPVYIFMHHHPVDSGLIEMDTVASFRSAKSFWKILDKFTNIKHIAFGHLHRIMHVARDSVTMHSTRSTTFQVSYQPQSKLEYLTNKEKPTYAIMEIQKNDTIRIHHHEYLDEKRYYEDGDR